MVVSPRAIPEREHLKNFILILKSLWEVQLLITILILKLGIAALENKAGAVEDLEVKKRVPHLLWEVGVEAEDSLVQIWSPQFKTDTEKFGVTESPLLETFNIQFDGSLDNPV